MPFAPLTLPIPLLADRTGGVVAALPDELVAVDASGAVRWRFVLEGDTPGAPFLTADGRLALVSGPRLILLQTELRPALSGWAMYRGNPQRSGRTQPAASGTRLLALEGHVNTGWRLRFHSPKSASGAIEHSTDLVHWEFHRPVEAVAGVNEVMLADPSAGRAGFYRLRLD